MKLNIAYPATGCQKLIEVSVIRTLIVMSHASVHCTHSTAVCRQFQIEDDRKQTFSFGTGSGVATQPLTSLSFPPFKLLSSIRRQRTLAMHSNTLGKGRCVPLSMLVGPSVFPLYLCRLRPWVGGTPKPKNRLPESEESLHVQRLGLTKRPPLTISSRD